LIDNMRAEKESSEFKRWQLAIGDKKEYDNRLGPDYVRIPKDLLSNDLIPEIYGEKIDPSDRSLASKVIVAGKNVEVMDLNNKILERMEGEAKRYFSCNKLSDKEEDYAKLTSVYQADFLNSIEGYGLPPHILNVKIGSIVMLLRNLSLKMGLCNGTRLQIVEVGKNIIRAKILTGRKEGEIASIPRIKLNPQENKLGLKMIRTQFPLMPAFAMTINKSQGQSFDQVGVSLSNPVFAHGQLYVALSRVRTRKGLRIYVKEGSTQGKLLEGSDDVFTLNVAYRQILEGRKDPNYSEAAMIQKQEKEMLMHKHGFTNEKEFD
jgi:ATP-dependent DNA helicase PIF1